jgi:ubiquinone/menaquinone biosynthesis C-methylase UbiE
MSRMIVLDSRHTGGGMNRYELLDLWDRLTTAPALASAFWGGLRARAKSPGLAPGHEAEVHTSHLEEAVQFPHYYLRSFHGQPNGYLSEESARIYDLGQSLFFLGGDGLVRKTLLRRLPEKASRILDLGCANGASTFGLARRFPEAKLDAVDLSPFFLARAKERAQRLRLSHRITFHQENAESMPCFEAGSFDLITSTFLHHEVPLSANRKIWREVKRLLSAGGCFAVLDELQLSDTEKARLIPAIAYEPHYPDYFQLTWEDELKEAGFSSIEIKKSWVSKTILAS